MKYVNVVIDNKSNSTDYYYTYRSFFEEIQIGQRVIVPFGRANSEKEAYVFDVVEEININDIPSLIGVSIVDSNIRKKYNLIIIGIKDRKGKFELNPNMNVKLGKDQIIMLIGAKANMKEFQKKYLKNK